MEDVANANLFQPWTMKVLNVCIVRRTVSEDYDSENMRVGVGMCGQSPFELSFFDWRSDDIFPDSCYTHWLVSQHQVTLCTFSAANAVLLRTCAARSGEADDGDCRHECDDDDDDDE